MSNVSMYDDLLELFGLCRHRRYLLTDFELRQIKSTDREKQIDQAWDAFHLFATSLNEQMVVIEAQKAIYFSTRCYQLVRDESGDRDKKTFPKPEDVLKGRLLFKFRRWLKMKIDQEAVAGQ